MTTTQFKIAAKPYGLAQCPKQWQNETFRILRLLPELQSISVDTSRKVTVKRNDIPHLSALSRVVMANTAINRNIAIFANRLARFAFRCINSLSFVSLSSLITMATEHSDNNPSLEEKKDDGEAPPSLVEAKQGDGNKTDANQDETSKADDPKVAEPKIDDAKGEDDVSLSSSDSDESEDDSNEEASYETPIKEPKEATVEEFLSNVVVENEEGKSEDEPPNDMDKEVVPVQPHASYLKVSDEIRLRSIVLPFRFTEGGMGIDYSSASELNEVLANDRLDAIRFNEPTNGFGVMIAARVMQLARAQKDSPTEDIILNADGVPVTAKSLNPEPPKTPPARAAKRKYKTPETSKALSKATPSSDKKGRGGGTQGALKPYELVLGFVTKKILDDAGFVPKDQTTRQNKFGWLIQCGFNSDKIANPVLSKILVIYAQIRLGFQAETGDEVVAAMIAIDTVRIKALKNENAKRSEDSNWMWPFVHYFNGHLVHRRMFPLNFATLQDDDEKLERTIRKNNTKTIWVDGVEASVETRPEVIKQLHGFLTKNLGPRFRTLPTDDGPPEDEAKPAPAAKRRRLSLQLYK